MGNQQQRSTQLTREEAQASTNWVILDATGKILGRLASEIAKILRGKHKVNFTPNVNCGDGVIVINAEKVLVSGSKEAQKVYRRYTGFIGGLRETPYRVMMSKKPTYIVRHAVHGMMPKTKLGRAQLKKLRIFVGDKHEMEAQKPIAIEA
ncbi:MAG: 50S ribosomal protein L13 [Chlamydiota bacterium]